MKTCPLSSTDSNEASATRASPPAVNSGQSFDMALGAAASERTILQSGTQPTQEGLNVPVSSLPLLLNAESVKAPSVSGANAAAAYRKNVEQPAKTSQLSGFQIYKDDQLLRNPGGRNYYLEEKKVVENSNKRPVSTLISKDFSDFFGNIRNFFGNLTFGTTVLHRNDKNQIVEGKQRGLVRTVTDFFKDLGSALSFGAWHPGSADAPHGLKNRFLYSVSKLKDAFFGDLLTGVPSSVNHMGKNLVLSGWNLAEVLPDAVTGHFEAGQKLTTTIFDNGHVAVEYLTDIIPTGDAWFRVHASNLSKLKPPILYNLKMPEYTKGDLRWENVRNTPFRKTIETIGVLLTDALSIGLLGQTGFSSNRRNQIE